MCLLLFVYAYVKLLFSLWIWISSNHFENAMQQFSQLGWILALLFEILQLRYVLHVVDLLKELEAARDDFPKVLRLLRGFFFWLKVSILWFFCISLDVLFVPSRIFFKKRSSSCTAQLIMYAYIFTWKFLTSNTFQDVCVEKHGKS